MNITFLIGVGLYAMECLILIGMNNLYETHREGCSVCFL